MTINVHYAYRYYMYIQYPFDIAKANLDAMTNAKALDANILDSKDNNLVPKARTKFIDHPGRYVGWDNI